MIIFYYSYIYDILTVKTDLSQRLRKLPSLSEKEKESRILIQKEWNRYKTQQHMATIQALDSIIYSQQRALNELRLESEDLYQEAIQVIINFIKGIQYDYFLCRRCKQLHTNLLQHDLNSYIYNFSWI